MPQVCEPDTSTCEDMVLQTCNADGSAIATTTDRAANDDWCLYGRCRHGFLYSQQFTAGATFQAAKPGVKHCMDQESVRAHTEITVNVHGPTGRVVGAAAVANPRIPALDACLADVFAAICFVPFEAPQATRPYWSSRYPYFADTPQHYEHLAEVESRCVRRERSQDASGPSLEDVAHAVRPALPAVRACYAKHGFQLTGRQWVDIAIDGETGGIGKAAAAYTPRRPTLDACIAGSLRDVCLKPFRGIRDSYNSLLRRSVFSFDANASQ